MGHINHKTYRKRQNTSPVALPRTPVSHSRTPVTHPRRRINDPRTPISHPRTPVNDPRTPVTHPRTRINDPRTPVTHPRTPVSEPVATLKTRLKPERKGGDRMKSRWKRLGCVGCYGRFREGQANN